MTLCLKSASREVVLAASSLPFRSAEYQPMSRTFFYAYLLQKDCQNPLRRDSLMILKAVACTHNMSYTYNITCSSGSQSKLKIAASLPVSAESIQLS